MHITISYKLRRLLRWVKRKLFKVKNNLPESPKQEIETSSTTEDVVLKSLDVKTKQEQTQWFQKKNDLRNVHFDLNPVWDNGHTLYGKGDGLPDEDYQPAAEIRAITVGEEKFNDEVKSDSNPWKDYDKFPVKDYRLTPQECFKLTDNGNDNSNA